MTLGADDDLADLLAQEDFLPPEALRRALANPAAIAPATLAVLAAAAEDPDAPSDRDVNLLFWGVHALAAVRDVRVFAPLLRLLRHDGETLEGILGDALGRTLPRVLASAYDGDADAFERFLFDTTLDEEVRYAAFQALAFLTRHNRFEPARTERMLVRFDTAGVAIENGLGWVAWAEAVAYLGLDPLAPRVEAAFRDRRIGEDFIDASWFRRALRQAAASPRDEAAFEGLPYGDLDDPLAALDWTAETYGQPLRNPFKTVGRNDPCPCGSGRKYKKCCLNAAEAAEALNPPRPGAR